MEDVLAGFAQLDLVDADMQAAILADAAAMAVGNHGGNNANNGGNNGADDIWN